LLSCSILVFRVTKKIYTKSYHKHSFFTYVYSFVWKVKQKEKVPYFFGNVKGRELLFFCLKAFTSIALSAAYRQSIVVFQA
jgi:hypothetical protein